MIKIFFGTCIISAFLMIGCKKDSEPVYSEPVIGPTIHSHVIIPLAVGNKWIRSVSLYDTTGKVFSSGIDSIVVLRDTIVEGTNWFILKMQGIEYIVKNRENGLWGLGGVGQYLWYKYPATPKDSFFASGNTSYFRVQSIDTSITVPAGLFSCYRYELDGSSSVGAIGGWHEIKFFSPDNGFVKNEFYSSTYTSTKHYLYSIIQLTAMTIKRNNSAT